tara:strand:+ start:697 stop:1344 length:648 start_codon:yes stop_codon:yes gene_type:complete
MASTEDNKDLEVPSTKKQAQEKAVVEASEFMAVHGEQSLEALKNLEETFTAAFNELGLIKADYDAYHKAFSNELGELTPMISDFVHGYMPAIIKSGEALASLEAQGLPITKVTKQLRKRNAAIMEAVADSKDGEAKKAIVDDWNKNGSGKKTFSKIARDHGIETRDEKPSSSEHTKLQKRFSKSFEKLSAKGKTACAKAIIKTWPDYFSASTKTS